MPLLTVSPLISANPSVVYLLSVAQEKLINSDVPLRLRVVSYLRLVNAAMQKSCKSSDATPIARLSYLERLQALIQIDPHWWQHCEISSHGTLRSDVFAIQDLLQPLTEFMQNHRHVASNEGSITVASR